MRVKCKLTKISGVNFVQADKMHWLDGVVFLVLRVGLNGTVVFDVQNVLGREDLAPVSRVADQNEPLDANKDEGQDPDYERPEQEIQRSGVDVKDVPVEDPDSGQENEPGNGDVGLEQPLDAGVLDLGLIMLLFFHYKPMGNCFTEEINFTGHSLDDFDSKESPSLLNSLLIFGSDERNISFINTFDPKKRKFNQFFGLQK